MNNACGFKVTRDGVAITFRVSREANETARERFLSRRVICKPRRSIAAGGAGPEFRKKLVLIQTCRFVALDPQSRTFISLNTAEARFVADSLRTETVAIASAVTGN